MFLKPRTRKMLKKKKTQNITHYLVTSTLNTIPATLLIHAVGQNDAETKAIIHSNEMTFVSFFFF